MNKQIVRTLLGHKDVQMGLRCLGSLRKQSAEPVEFCIHDDGTIDNTDKGNLQETLVNVRFIARKEADHRVADLLSSYPKCLEFRRKLVFTLKLFDVALLAEEDSITFCDSDVFFFRPFSGMFSFPDKNANCIFMQDIQEAYSIRPWHLRPFGTLRFPHVLNSGLFVIRKNLFDLDALEKFFSLTENPSWSPWLEQTAWGLLAGNKMGYLWDGDYVKVIQSEKCFRGGIVAGHFVGPVRKLLGKVDTKQVSTSSYVEIPLTAMKPLTAPQLFLDQLRRYLKTRVFPLFPR
ncbi:MAG: hypothetical protein HQM09_05015 [Candidatus Riflebacteria bacterium]|nr:hypothetical protein [Candidatus Riflebacteria bacterium]